MDRIDTRHAGRRIAQRGICEDLLNLLLERGDREVEVGDGCMALSLSHEARLSIAPAAADRLRHVVAVLSGDRLVTVMHANRPGASRYRRRWK